MPNRKYQKGARKERQVVNQLRADGYIATRSAASKTCIDVWAVNEDVVLLIQCKHDTVNIAAEIKKLQAIKVPPGVKKQLWIFRDRKPASILNIK